MEKFIRQHKFHLSYPEIGIANEITKHHLHATLPRTSKEDSTFQTYIYRELTIEL